MAVLLLVLPLGLAIFFLGLLVWTIFKHFLTTEVPSALQHPVKFRILDCMFIYVITLGNILEKLRICSMASVARFVHDRLFTKKKDPKVVVTNLRFGTIPVRLFQPKAIACRSRGGIIFYHGGAAVMGSLGKELANLWKRKGVGTWIILPKMAEESHEIPKPSWSSVCPNVKLIDADEPQGSSLLDIQEIGADVWLFPGRAHQNSYHNMCLFLALETDSVLLSVGYRKLPDHHYPVITNDCLNASIHFLKILKTYGVNPSQVVICGESAGGGVVAQVTQALVSQKDLPQIRAQILIYPTTQAINLQLPSFQQNQNVPFLTRDFMLMCLCKYMAIDLSWRDAMVKGACIPPDTWKKYRKWLSSDNIRQSVKNRFQESQLRGPFNEAAYLETKHLLDVANAPLLADDEIIAQLPEAFLVSCEYDVFRDDVLLYKKRLEDQGVPVSWDKDSLFIMLVRHTVAVWAHVCMTHPEEPCAPLLARSTQGMELEALLSVQP
ncbi:Arylacetamide deacetylase-like 4 [Heterocephalus glaber]|uniref:Arylacetamide deacetylase-like 4 n=1 Tax=Heterocephalus glaber TaxID=10181 RepID=G5BD96_HETGA|nr:Arylacetamide deacetylase-like 4 [Heterocephalus glaber]